jgi:hypothetical protein
MHDDFAFKSALIETDLPREEIFARLASQTEIPGSVISLGPRGVRLVPEELGDPTTYIGPNGKIVEIVVKDLDGYAVDVYLTRLARALGVTIATETVEYS